MIDWLIGLVTGILADRLSFYSCCCVSAGNFCCSQIKREGGATGGWPSHEHECFLRIWTQVTFSIVYVQNHAFFRDCTGGDGKGVGADAEDGGKGEVYPFHA